MYGYQNYGYGESSWIWLIVIIIFLVLFLGIRGYQSFNGNNSNNIPSNCC